MWWRELGLPVRAHRRARRAAARHAPPEGSSDRAADAAYAELAGKTVKQARTRDRRAARASRASSLGEPRPITHAGQVLREGRPPARDRHQPAVVHPHPRRTATAPARGGARSCAGTRRTCGPLRELGGGAQQRLADQPAAVLRRAVPGLVPPRRRTATPDYDHPLVPDEDRLPIDPSTDVPGGLRPRRSAASRAASSATPT